MQLCITSSRHRACACCIMYIKKEEIDWERMMP